MPAQTEWMLQLYISPESYDRISVIKGPQTVQYANTGSAATVLFERQPEKLT